MMSATSSGPKAGFRSPSSGARRSSHRRSPPAPVHTTRPTAARTSGTTSLHNATDASASSRMSGQLDRSEPSQQRHRHSADLVDGEVGDQPLQWLLVADQQADAFASVESECLETPGQSIGTAVPLAQRELAAVGQVPPRHRIREGGSHPGHQLRLEQCHDRAAGPCISTVRLLPERCAGCRPAWW